MKSPKWSRDELILALDLYFRVDPVHTSEQNAEIQELSNILNRLPIHPISVHGDIFRNPNGVYMKLCNFLRFDPSYTGAGLTRGGKLEEEIWNEFASDRPKLKAIANSIRGGITAVSAPSDSEQAAIDEYEEFPEGRILTQVHTRRERNPSASRKKKLQTLADNGTLACEVCGFDFNEVFGDLGKGFVECHHLVPLSSLSKSKKTKLADLAIVCANCHRMLHRMRPWPTLDQLRRVLDANKLLRELP